MKLSNIPNVQLKKLNIIRQNIFTYKELNSSIRKSLFSLNEGVCYLCGLAVELGKFTIDHAIPISLNPLLEYSVDNMFLSHSFCNGYRKDNSLIKSARELKAFVNASRLNKYIVNNYHYDPLLFDLKYFLDLWKTEAHNLTIKNGNKRKIKELHDKIKKYEMVLKHE